MIKQLQLKYITFLLQITLLQAATLSSVFAITVTNYETTSFQTNLNNQRAISIEAILKSDSVLFDGSDTVNEQDPLSSVDFSLCDSQGCGQTAISFPQGTAQISNGTILYTPQDPTALDPVSFGYAVSVVSTGNPSGQALISINITPTSTNRPNTLNVSIALEQFCSTTTQQSVIDACIQYHSQSPAQKAEALNSITPEEVSAELTSTITLTRLQSSQLLSRLNALRHGGTRLDMSGLN